MSKHIIKYKLHGGVTPWYVEDAGLLKIDGWLYGISKDDSECYIPSDIEIIVKADLKTLLSSKEITKRNYKTNQEETLTKQQKEEFFQEMIGKKTQ